MQRTVYDRTVTPGAAAKLGPALEEAYPVKRFEHVHLATRVDGRKRVRIVIQLRKSRRS